MTERPPDEVLAANYLADADRRVLFQQEYTLSGFKTLVLLEGAAIIALLTYAGHDPTNGVGNSFVLSIALYVGALIPAVLGYVAAYLSQGQFSHFSMMEAHRLLKLESQSSVSQSTHEKRGSACVILALISWRSPWADLRAALLAR